MTSLWRHRRFDFNEIHMQICIKAYVRGIQNFSLIKHKKAEIYTYSREVNKELWRKNEYWFTVTLTFDPRSPILIGLQQYDTNDCIKGSGLYKRFL